jgi:hypothetical protein
VNAWFFRAPWWQLSLLLGTVVGLTRFAGDRLLEDDTDVLRRVMRAARRGPVPEDPVQREQARGWRCCCATR